MTKAPLIGLLTLAAALVALDITMYRAAGSERDRLREAESSFAVHLKALRETHRTLDQLRSAARSARPRLIASASELLMRQLLRQRYPGLEGCRVSELRRPVDVPIGTIALLQQGTYGLEASPVKRAMEDLAGRWRDDRDEASYERFGALLALVDQRVEGHGVPPLPPDDGLPWKQQRDNGGDPAWSVERDVVFFECLKQLGLVDEVFAAAPSL
jgi:hypothetical protein